MGNPDETRGRVGSDFKRTWGDATAEADLHRERCGKHIVKQCHAWGRLSYSRLAVYPLPQPLNLAVPNVGRLGRNGARSQSEDTLAE